MTFRVGQKVVCVDASGVNGVRERAVYEVSYVHHDGCIQVGFDPHQIDGFYAYRPSRFRPVVERKTDISSLKALLNPKTAETV